MKVRHPWQNGSTELLSHAISHLHKMTDFDRRMAFLILDVTVETGFKTFLALPDEVTGIQIPYHERKKAIEGNFHELARTVDRAAGSRLRGIDLSHIHFYHDLRNKLYHQGNGITISMENAQGYAELAVDLLKILLDIDLFSELAKPEIKAKEQADLQALRARIETKDEEIDEELRRLMVSVELTIEKIEPRLILPSFAQEFESIRQEFETTEYYGKNEEVYEKVVLSSNIDVRLEFSRNVVELLRSVLTDEQTRTQLFAPSLDPFASALAGREVELEAIASYMVSSGWPTVLDLYWGIVEIIVNQVDSSWYQAYSMASSYPHNILAYAEETDLEGVIRDGEEQLSVIRDIRSAMQLWLKQA